jgi:energy-coupling factor transporter ATP-binding protein EcfA2
MEDGSHDPPRSPSGAGSTPGFWPAGDAAQLLDAKEFVIPVLGAGIGVGPGGLPSTWDISSHLASTFEPEGGHYSDTSDLNKVADETSATPIQLQESVAAFVDSHDPHPTAFTRALGHLPSKFIITLTYDRLLELSAEQERVGYESLLNDEDGLQEAVDRLTDPNPPQKLTILHLHGRIDWPEGIVLDGPSYQKLANRGNFDKLVFALVKLKTMCFIGTTLNEFHVRYHMRANRGRRTHVLLCKADEEQRFTEGPNGITHQRDGIIVCPYPDHPDLDGFAAKLAAVTRAPIPSTPVATPRTDTARTHALPFGYVPNVLYEPGHRVDDTDRLAAAILGRDYGPQSFGEADIAQGQRTLVLGAPGSGKSELLRRAGELLPAEEFPVLIRCADLDTDPGDALTVLERAAERGVGLRGDVVVNREALKRRRFHFFLDGLDEKPVSQQERLAELIVDLADAFPQHRFTVATRPVDAIKAFPRASEEEAIGWMSLDLAPDRAWQTRYLEAAGVSLDELEGRMPALRDLRGLLQLPFFLAKTVELEKNGQLRAFEDLWALVQALVAATLERELGIALPQGEVRAWLRNVALTLHLAGRTTLALQEIEQIDIPQEAGQIVGSAKDIADALILRFLLQESEGNYSFTHRIIGEALAAEALNELPPEGAILDAVAPVCDEEVRGVRQDWLVPLTFLLSRNSDWRAAVRERDPLAAARAVPASTSHDERRDAARLIWSTYCERKVWAWGYDSPDLLDDAEALGRLLRTEDMRDVVEEVRRGIDDESAQIQGNAVRVLSRVAPPGFVDDLRSILGDDGREAVVRRQAAIAARDIGARELLPLIIQRAAHPADTAEAQDASICAFDLAGEDGLIDTAMELAKHPESRPMAQSRLNGRIAPADMIRVIRASAEAESDPYGSERELFEEALAKLPTNPEAAVVTDAAYIAAKWECSIDILRRLAEANHLAALEGFIAAQQDDKDRAWALTLVVEHYSIDELEQAGAPDSLIERRRFQIAPTEEQLAAQREADEQFEAWRAERAERQAQRERDRAEHQPPSLEEALGRARTEVLDMNIAYNSQYFAREVKDLSQTAAEELAKRLDDWWPEKPFADTITRTGPTSWSQENFAAAWLWFGPPLDKELTPGQWAEIASCGVLFHDQIEWLRRKATEEAKQELARICAADDARPWHQALQATPGPLPGELINAVVAALETATDQVNGLEYIGERLYEAAGAEPIRSLSNVSEDFASALRPLLAKDGDEGAQLTLLRELREQLERGELARDRELGWLDAVDSQEALEDLFACVRLVWGRAEPTETSGWWPRDVLTPVMNAIRNIDGRKAVEGYDELLKDPQYRFMWGERDAVAHSLLRVDGLKAAAQAARELGLPLVG